MIHLFNIIKNSYKILHEFDNEFLKKNDITLNEAILIYSLANKESCSASQLSEAIGLSNSRVSRVLAEAEIKGYISRHIGNKDKREMLFMLTELGEKKQIEIRSNQGEYTKVVDKLNKLLNNNEFKINKYY